MPTAVEVGAARPIMVRLALGWMLKPDRIGKLVDIQAKLKQDKGIGYKRWLTKHNLKVIWHSLKNC